MCEPNQDKRLVDIVDRAWVSTVFLRPGLRWDEAPLPELFETMIFGGPHDMYQERYATWDAAEARHNFIVSALRAGNFLES